MSFTARLTKNPEYDTIPGTAGQKPGNADPPQKSLMKEPTHRALSISLQQGKEQMTDIDFTVSSDMQIWDNLTYTEKNRVLYERQKALLDLFLEKNAISQAQHDKSLHDLSVKMRYAPTNDGKTKTE